MTEKTLDWLNHNRHRAYPFENNLGIVQNGARIPECFILDCLVMDTRHLNKIPELIVKKVQVTPEETKISLTYDNVDYTFKFSGGSTSGADSFIKVNGNNASDFPKQQTYLSLTCSSHAYNIATVGEGLWEFEGRILPSKILTSTSSGVQGIETNGSYGVEDYTDKKIVTGDIHLVDGYRTQPIIINNKVQIQVGTNYGIDPCHYPYELLQEKVDCSQYMFFFCGQNAINTGNINLTGGPGVIVKQGRGYTAKKDILDTYNKIGIKQGETVPCIEIQAAAELLRIYRPSK